MVAAAGVRQLRPDPCPDAEQHVLIPVGGRGREARGCQPRADDGRDVGRDRMRGRGPTWP